MAPSISTSLSTLTAPVQGVSLISLGQNATLAPGQNAVLTTSDGSTSLTAPSRSTLTPPGQDAAFATSDRNTTLPSPHQDTSITFSPPTIPELTSPTQLKVAIIIMSWLNLHMCTVYTPRPPQHKPTRLVPT